MTRIVTAPLELAGGLTRSQLAMCVAADALVRRATAEGRKATWTAPSLAGDLTAQVAVDRDLARAGEARASMSADEYAERVHAHEVATRADLRQRLAELRVDVDLDAGATDNDTAQVAARTAFVRLFDAGVLQQVERVVDVCSRCATVVAETDMERTDVDAVALTVRVPFAGDTPGSLDVELVDAELFAGVVAIAVADDHEAAGADVELPVVGRTVPVVADGDGPPRPLVPAHDPDAFEAARRLGLTPIDVLDEDAVAVIAPVEGLARYAARSAMTELLIAEGAVVDRRDATEHVSRCRRCGTVVLARLGRHWFVDAADLENAAADAVRGDIVFSPSTARDTFLDAAGTSGWWAVTHHGRAGQAAPVARCVDCGAVSVAVDIPTSCGKCMGTLVASDEVLDARFVAALWPLAEAGWPGDDDATADAAAGTTLLVSRRGIVRWALPIAALGLRLTGAVPFAVVAIADAVGGRQLVAPVDDVTDRDAAVVRVEILRGDGDPDEAARDADSLREPVEGDNDVDDFVATTYEPAFGAGTPGVTVAPLAQLARDGVHSADRVRALAAPLLGG
ncbi:MAG TPA: class I tRNA ligase family protein [Acidimicrobiales bacterium]|nr:class I tRNA ligase family protein [Acidimicrobiales bacterium]